MGDGERIESAREKTGRAGEGFGFGECYAANRDVVSSKRRCYINKVVRLH